MTERLLWEEVNEGDELPALEFPITVKNLVMGVVGTRDFAPYHHNPEYTKSIGNRDQFVNTMFNQALFGRFVTDWCGPDADFRGTTLRMVGQLCPGDTAILEGRVARTQRDGDDYRVELELSSRNQLGTACIATASLALPSREGGAVKPRLELEKPRVELDPELPGFARGWLGTESTPRQGAYPVSDVQILYWADMVEDTNPLYEDGEYARGSRHGGVIAPPMSLITWTMDRPGRSGANPDAPDVDEPDRKPWPPREEELAASPRFEPPGTTATIATISEQAYGKPLRPGDRVSSSTELVNCSGLKETRLGKGYFVTILNNYYNQHQELVGTNLFTLLRYGITEDGA